MALAETLWSFKTKNFRITWSIEDEPLDTRGMDEALAKRCRQHVNSGNWRCFNSLIEVTHIPTGLVLGEAHLGGSIYKHPKDFRDHFHMTKNGHGSYFRDKVQSALSEARKTLATLHNMPVRARSLEA